MGEELTGEEDRSERKLNVEVVGTDEIATVSILRNGREVHSQPGDDRMSLSWIDTEDFGAIARKGYDGNPFVYYRVRVVQADGAMAWSSPIWVLGD